MKNVNVIYFHLKMWLTKQHGHPPHIVYRFPLSCLQSTDRKIQIPLQVQSNDATHMFPARAFHSQSTKKKVKDCRNQNVLCYSQGMVELLSLHLYQYVNVLVIFSNQRDHEVNYFSFIEKNDGMFLFTRTILDTFLQLIKCEQVCVILCNQRLEKSKKL